MIARDAAAAPINAMREIVFISMTPSHDEAGILPALFTTDCPMAGGSGDRRATEIV